MYERQLLGRDGIRMVESVLIHHMQTIRNIEFFNDPEGGVMVRDTEGVHTYQPEDRGIVYPHRDRISESIQGSRRDLPQEPCKRELLPVPDLPPFYSLQFRTVGQQAGHRRDGALHL